jgi:hypothetical protein
MLSNCPISKHDNKVGLRSSDQQLCGMRRCGWGIQRMQLLRSK